MKKRFTTNGRLLYDVFASYNNTFNAFCELINNSIQANAKNIKIIIQQYPDETFSPIPIQKIIIEDDGIGVSSSTFDFKILDIATPEKESGKGIGRFAAFQLGKHIEIETLAYDNQLNKYTISKLVLNANDIREKKIENYEFEVESIILEKKEKPFYRITIKDFYLKEETTNDNKKKIIKDLLPENLFKSLFLYYSTELLEKNIFFYINNILLNTDDFLLEQIENQKFNYKNLSNVEFPVSLKILHYEHPKKDIKIAYRISNNELHSIGYSDTIKMDIPDSNGWMIYVDSPILNEENDLYRNLAWSDIDVDSKDFLETTTDEVQRFFIKKFKDYYNFEKNLENDDYYPYRTTPVSSNIKKITFNQIAFFIEKQHSILKNKNELRKIIYSLTDMAISNGNIEEIISKLIKLDINQITRFKELLNNVELENVIEFCDDIVKKSKFLDLLYELIYSDISEYIKERSQLHKIIEKKLWIFGEQYSNTPYLFSDKNLENSLIQLRNKYYNYEPTIEDENLIEINNHKIRDITDLFFFNDRILDDEKHEIMIVELKAPKCAIGQKELNQVEKYAFDIEQRGNFSKNLKYKIILVSSKLTGFAKSMIGTIDSSKPTLYKKLKNADIEIHVAEWSFFINRCRQKLSYLGNALKIVDSQILKILVTDYPDLNIENLIITT